MAYYDYYRRHNPSMWGRPEYTMDSPPAPRYQPQPQWRGVDYYRAHADGMADTSHFDYVWGRLKGHFRTSISRRDAESCHRRVYGGLVDVSTMMPAEIGSAAGYEAWRFWEHHRGIYRQPLMEDRERESEALVGLAVGEAEKLWEYTRRHGDRYGKREALETAASVAVKFYRKGGYSASGGMRYEEPYLMRDSRYPEPGYRHRHRRSSSVSPLDFEDDRRRGFSGSDSDYERDYNEYGPPPSTYHLGSPSVASAALPSGYGRRRASSTYYDNRPPMVTGTSPYIPPMDSALSTSPSGALIIPPPGSSIGHHHSSSFGGYGVGTSYDYRDSSGRVVHRTTHGDPTSEYGHLEPGTYMITGGSSSHGRRRHRKSHSGGIRYVM